MDKDLFRKNYNIDCSEHTEKVGKFTYLSWAYAIKYIKNIYDEVSYRVKKYPDENGNRVLPYLKTPIGCFVTIELRINLQEFEYDFPILDNKNNPLGGVMHEGWAWDNSKNKNTKQLVKTREVTSFDVNTSIKRGLVKAIAINTGLGLYLYAGEDIPQDLVIVDVEEEFNEVMGKIEKIKNFKEYNIIKEEYSPKFEHTEYLKPFATAMSSKNKELSAPKQNGKDIANEALDSISKEK